MKTTTNENETNTWAEKRFGLKAGDVLGYNAGSAYDKVWVSSMPAARKVEKAVKGKTCNGGFFHGMEKGGISLRSDGAFEVMC